MDRFHWVVLAVVLGCLAQRASADVVTFFDSSQIATPLANGVTSDTISCDGYILSYTRDKLFTGGGSTIIGRTVRVPWPDGAEAQAVTTGPALSKARVTLTRVDGDVFDFLSFSAKLLANTWGAGGAIEIMPSLDGEDGFNDPLPFDVSGVTNQVFSFSTTPNPYGQSTAPLVGFDKYVITLYVDFALVSMSLEGAPVPEPGALGLAAMLIGMVFRRNARV